MPGCAHHVTQWRLVPPRGGRLRKERASAATRGNNCYCPQRPPATMDRFATFVVTHATEVERLATRKMIEKFLDEERRKSL